MNNSNFDVTSLAKDFGTHEPFIINWLNEFSITDTQITFALENFNKQQARKFVGNHLVPMDYFLDYPSLLNNVIELDVEFVKSLPEDIYEKHLKQLIKADEFSDHKNTRSFPYNSYDAEIFCVYRHFKLKKDTDFARLIYSRKIAHASYPKAKTKLRGMCTPYLY